jgi:hypothetical protein
MSRLFYSPSFRRIALCGVWQVRLGESRHSPLNKLLTEPDVRRAGSDRVSVFVAMSQPVTSVALRIYKPDQGTPGTPVKEAVTQPIRLGAGLMVALPTAVFSSHELLIPNTVYEYDMAFDGTTLGGMGLLKDGTVGGHVHEALGYVPGARPTFVTPPVDVTKLVIGSCRPAQAVAAGWRWDQ